MNSVAFGMTILMGLTGSLHCAGMCGPIVWIMPFQMMGGARKWLAIAMYHFGRISVYASFALALHSFRSIFHPQWQQYISIVLGGFLLVAGLATFLPIAGVKISLPWSSTVMKRLGKFTGRPGMLPVLASGILNGLLPCGLVYMALSASLAAASVSQAVLFMYAFGLGTVPMLVGITILKGRLKTAALLPARKFVPVALFLFGLLFMLRGLNLGIPYLSPRIAIEQGTIKSDCCHKPH